MLTVSAQNIVDRENIDQLQVVKDNCYTIFELFLSGIPYQPPNQISIIYILFDYRGQISKFIKYNDILAPVEFSFKFQLVEMVNDLIKEGWADTALMTIIAMGMDDSYSEPQILGLINASKQQDQIKTNIILSKNKKQGNALLKHMQAVRKEWEYSKNVMKHMNLNYTDHQDLQIWCQQKLTHNLIKNQFEGKVDLFKLYDIGRIKSEACALLINEQFKQAKHYYPSPTCLKFNNDLNLEDQSISTIDTDCKLMNNTFNNLNYAINKLVSEWLRDQDRYGPALCTLNSTDCYDLLDSEARDYLRSMGIFTDAYPDVLQSSAAKRDHIYTQNQFSADELEKYQVLAPITANCLSILDEFEQKGIDLNIVFVNDTQNLEEVLCNINESRRVQIDSEWDPINQVGENTEVQIVQLQTNQIFQILDHHLLKNERKQQNFFEKLMSSPNINKVGQDLSNDFINLNLDFKFQLKNVTDIKDRICQTGGLAKLVKERTGLQMCKQWQVGNWSKRPLLRSQEHYAIMDVYVLHILLNKLSHSTVNNVNM